MSSSTFESLVELDAVDAPDEILELGMPETVVWLALEQLDEPVKGPELLDETNVSPGTMYPAFKRLQSAGYTKREPIAIHPRQGYMYSRVDEPFADDTDDAPVYERDREQGEV